MASKGGKPKVDVQVVGDLYDPFPSVILIITDVTAAVAAVNSLQLSIYLTSICFILYCNSCIHTAIGMCYEENIVKRLT